MTPGGRPAGGGGNPGSRAGSRRRAANHRPRWLPPVAAGAPARRRDRPVSPGKAAPVDFNDRRSDIAGTVAAGSPDAQNHSRTAESRKRWIGQTPSPICSSISRRSGWWAFAGSIKTCRLLTRKSRSSRSKKKPVAFVRCRPLVGLYLTVVSRMGSMFMRRPFHGFVLSARP